MSNEKQGTPVTQEFILKLIGWFVFLSVVALIVYTVGHTLNEESRKMDETSKANATPVTH